MVPVLMDLVCEEESNVFPAILSAINIFLGRLKMKEHSKDRDEQLTFTLLP